MPRSYKQTAKFTAFARCVLDKDKGGKSLALASLSDLKTILPEDASLYPDLLPIAGNVCVANLGNENGDVIDTETALALAPYFKNKFINLEHDRKSIVGHITTVGLTKFNSQYKLGNGSEVLKAEAVANKLEPFNIAIGGFIYRAAFPDIADKVEESNDPDSPDYLTVSFSWEVAFDNHNLLVGSKEFAQGEIITDPDKVEEMDSFLKCRKGSGQLPDGRPVYRHVRWDKNSDGSIVEDSIFAMGAALTLAPAGEVAGVLTTSNPELNEEPTQEASASVTQNNPNDTKTENTDEKNSLSTSAHVTKNTTITMRLLTHLNDLKKVTDENVKEISFANINSIVDAGLQEVIAEKAREYQAEVDKEKQAAAAAKEQAEKTAKEVETVKQELVKANDALAALQKQQAEAAATQKFNERMSFFDEKFELADADRKAIASQIKGLDDTAFASVSENLSALLSAKSKEAIAKAKQEAEASLKDGKKPEDAKQAAAAALAAAQPEGAALPNSVNADKSLTDKYAAAFELGKGIEFTFNK